MIKITQYCPKTDEILEGLSIATIHFPAYFSYMAILALAMGNTNVLICTSFYKSPPISICMC